MANNTLNQIDYKGTVYDIEDSTARGVADTAVQSVKVNGTALTPDANQAVDITAIPASIVSAGALANGMTATTQTTSDDSTKLATTAFVHDVVDLLPSPMVYKGTLGTGGTITTLPVDGTAEVGDTYKVITAGTYASQAAKVGDMFICLTKATSSNTWSYVPSGDDTDVTQVSAGTGLTTASGSPITTTGTIKAKLKSSTALAEAATNSTTSGKSYAVNVDSNGDLACNVPWTDTTYSAATTTTAGLMSAQDKTDLGNVKTQANWNTNNGVKNLAPLNAATTPNTGYFANTSVNLPAGTYVISYRLTTTGSFGLGVTVDGSAIAKNSTSPPYNNTLITHEITANTSLTAYQFYTNGGATVTDFMITPKSLYDADSTYEPYALPNSTLTQQTTVLEEMNGAKNLAPYNSGEHTGNASYWFQHTNCIDISAGTSVYLVFDYTVTAGQYSIQLTDENGQIISGTAAYTTEGTTSGHKTAKVTIPTGKTAKGYNSYHSSNATVTVSNFMIVPAEIYEAGFTDYQPYALSNAELTAKEQTNENNISWANNYSYKNLINVTRDSIKAANPNLIWTDYTVSNHGGLSFTVNPDLSITVSGTTTSQSVEFNILRRTDGKTIFKEVGNYRIDGKVQSGKGMLAANRTVSGSGVRYGADEGATATFDVSQSDLSAPVGIWYGINEGVGVNVDMTIYPMICLSTMDRTYQQYAPSNAELYAMIQALQS